MYISDTYPTPTYLSLNEYLDRKSVINEEITRCTGKINFIEKQSISISGSTADYDSINVHTSNLSRPPEQFTIKIEIFKKQRQDKYDELEALNNFFRRSIALLGNEKERTIIELHDVDNMKLPEIEQQQNYTHNYAKKLHKQAVKHLAQCIAQQRGE